MIDIKFIAESLGKAKKVPSGWLCQCPCHDDNEASLSLKVTSKGNLALNCFSGCTYLDLLAEIKERGLLPDRKKPEEKKKSSSSNKPEKIYSYVDEHGKELFQKVRFPNSKGVHRHWNEDLRKFVWNIQGIRNVLYNLPAVIKSEKIYLCEGEKDADNLNSLGFTATTNNCGAIAWNDTFNSFLADKIVIICQDKDAAGEKRTAKLKSKLSGVVKELRLFIAPDLEGNLKNKDVTDWLEGGGNPADIFSLSTSLIEKESKDKYATRDKYFEVFDLVLDNPRKCIFSEKLMTLEPQSGLWNPAINLIDVLKSEFAVLNESSRTKYQLGLVQPHFFAYERTKLTEFLVDVPEWDQSQDPISEMAYFITLKKDSGVTECHFSELLKEWMATMFRRLYDPMIQNRICVLQGNQGLGKDTWIDHLVGGLGQFAVPLSVMKEDKDMYLKLHRGLCMMIPEFDRTAKTEVSTLKDIITTPSTDIRAPYDRDSKIRSSRCSFISSANIENILRDYTGNRRFMIFEVEKITYAYNRWSSEEKKAWQMQCLAEAAYLAKIDYRASDESHKAMKDYIFKKTPDDPIEDTYREFTLICQQRFGGIMGGYKETLTEHELSEVMRELKDRLGINIRAIREQLRRKCGNYKTEGDRRVWTYQVPVSQ